MDPDHSRAEAPAAIPVAIFSDQELIRAGLTTLLSQCDRTEVLDESTGSPGPQVVLFDLVNATGAARPRALRQLRKLLHDQRAVVAVTRDSSRDLAAKARDLGCVEVVPLSVSATELLDVLHDAARRPPEDREGSPSQLTRREKDIVQLVARGLSNTEIAEHLFLSVNSVKTYIRTAYRKMGVTTRSQAVLWAVRHGLGPEAHPPESPPPAPNLRSAGSVRQDRLELDPRGDEPVDQVLAHRLGGRHEA